MLAGVIAGTVGAGVLFICWCCCVVASDADEAMGYDNFPQDGDF